MGGVKISVHPLFFVLGFVYAATGRIALFLIYTISAVSHELGHSLVASGMGYRLNKVTLMPFGAMVSGETEGMRERDEILIALSGPLLNLLVGVLFNALWWTFPETYAFTDVIAEANFSLALINFLPVYPLDGGRIFFASLSLMMDRKKAKKISKAVGLIFSLLLFALFIASIFFTINVSLGFFAVFVFLGVINNDKENVYVKLDMAFSVPRLKKGMKYSKIGVDGGVTIKKLITLLNPNALNEVVVYKNGKEVAVLSPERISNLIKVGDLSSPIIRYLAVKEI